MKRAAISLLFCLYFSSFTFLLHAQSIDKPTPSRDAAAVAVLQNAITALGGPALQEIRDCTVEGTIRTGDQRSSIRFVWKISGAEFRFEDYSGTSQQIFATGHGKAASQKNGKTTGVPYHVARAAVPYFAPGLVLLNEFNNPNYAISVSASETRNGRAVIRVRIADMSDEITTITTEQDWYLDASTFVPVAVRYRIPDYYDAATKPIVAFKDFGRFQQVNGMLIPYSIRTNVEGIVREATVNSAVCNTGIPPTEFDLVTGGAQ